MKFKSKISNSSILGLGLFITFFFVFPVYLWIKNPEKITVSILASVFSLLLAGFFLLFFNTLYEIDSSKLKYKSSIIRGQIPINSIREIQLINSIWNLKTALKMSLSSNVYGLGNEGMFIYYNKAENVFISPEQPELFLEELLKLNPAIKINRF